MTASPTTAPQPHVREAGQGPAVVCLHANASTSTQWRGLIERLAPRHRVLAPDLWSAGASPAWPGTRALTLQDEVDLLEGALAGVEGPMVWVGHSYGAAVALRAAVGRPQRVCALALYEPTLFALLAAGGAPLEAAGIRATVDEALAALAAGDADAAARTFIDYWMGPGAWAQTPPHRKPAITAAVGHIGDWAHALFSEPTPIEALARLQLPVLLMTGARSTAAAHGVARRLAAAWPLARRVEFAALGHMGPLTHPQPVIDTIEAFVREVAA